MSFIFIPCISIANTFSAQEVRSAPEVNPFKNCHGFLKTGLENDNWSNLNGNDEGYTHGHRTQIIRHCDSGADISISWDSHFFTEIIGFYELPTEDKLVVMSRFERETRLAIEYTNWRDFDQEIYQTAEFTIGSLSRDNLGLAGMEHKAFHDFMSSFTDASDFENQRNEHGDIVIDRFDILKYDYIREDREENFFGGKIAFGKSYSLDGLRKICDDQCVDYFRTEAGVEILSLKHGSNVYIFSEINKRMPYPLDALSIFASIKAQRNEGIDGVYNEASFGLKFRIPGSKFQLYCAFKKREFAGERGPVSELDNDEDDITYIGLYTPI